MSRVRELCASAFAIAAIANVGFADEPTAGLDCSIYRQGPLQSGEMSIFRLPPNDDDSNYERTTVHYRPEYDFGGPPNVNEDGRPSETLLVDINIDDGQPLPKDVRYSSNPAESTFFNMLIKGWPFQNLGRKIGIFADVPMNLREFGFGEVVDGKVVYEPVQFERTGKVVADFDEIDVLDASAEAKEKYEFYIRQNDEEEIMSFMLCDTETSAIVPHCQIFENTDSFALDYGIRRNQMDRIQTVRQHAHGFAQCLTAPVEEDSDG